MFAQTKSNRIIYEREKVKVSLHWAPLSNCTMILTLLGGQDHVMHIERLRSIKPTIQITRPKKPSHLKTNAKREMQNLGTCCSLSPLSLVFAEAVLRFLSVNLKCEQA